MRSWDHAANAVSAVRVVLRSVMLGAVSGAGAMAELTVSLLHQCYAKLCFPR